MLAIVPLTEFGWVARTKPGTEPVSQADGPPQPWRTTDEEATGHRTLPSVSDGSSTASAQEDTEAQG